MHLTVDRSSFKSKGLISVITHLNDSIVSNFFSKATSAFGYLEKLFLRSCDIGAKGMGAIVNALVESSCRSLTQLDISFNNLCIACLQCFHQHIEVLSILKYFATSLSTKCKYLRQLDLSANKLGACDDPDLSAIVSQLTGSLGNALTCD